MTDRNQVERVATGDTTPWIAAIRPCDPECPGWAVFDIGGGELEIQRCDECWHNDPCPPDDTYYQTRPECLKVLELARHHSETCAARSTSAPEPAPDELIPLLHAIRLQLRAMSPADLARVTARLDGTDRGDAALICAIGYLLSE